jgi:predicted lipoprotein with Yx(FWY)xxD motif
MHTKTPAILALTLLSVALAGCNRDKTEDTTATTADVPAETTPAPADTPAVTEPAPPADTYTVDHFVVGGTGKQTYLADSQGRPLFVLKDDDAAVKCVGDCLTTWRAVSGPTPVSDLPGIPATAISSVTRPDGTTQVTYYGHPLYYYAPTGTPEIPEVTVIANESPWGRWYRVSPRGETVELTEGVPTTDSPTAAGADARDMPTQSPGAKPEGSN